MPKPPLGRGGGTASAVTERLSLARAPRSGCPLYNLSVCFADSSPSRGASGEEARLHEMPKPPLGRGGGTASAVTERLSLARAPRSGCPLYNLSVCFADSSPSRGASGEEAKFYEMPRSPLGRSNSDDWRRKQGVAVGAAASRMQATAHSTIQTKTPPTAFEPSAALCAYSVSSGQWIRPWPRCCALPSCRRRRSGTRCSGPERSAAQPG